MSMLSLSLLLIIVEVASPVSSCKRVYRMVSIVGCRKEADDLQWKGMVLVGGFKQPSFPSTSSNSGLISTRGRSVVI